MKRETKKVANIAAEISTYFLERQAQEISAKITNCDDKVVIAVIAKHMVDIEKTVDSIREYLSYPRAYEVEEYYWELTGENENEETLAVVGSMVDEAMLDYNGEEVYLQVTRFKKPPKKDKEPKKDKKK